MSGNPPTAVSRGHGALDAAAHERPPAAPHAGEDGLDTVATLRAGQALDTVFACTGKQRLQSRAGDAYLAIELRDRTGTIKARAFRGADLLAGRFERGDLVRVRGRVERFRDDLTVAVEQIDRVQADDAGAERFLPTSRRDLDELEGFFEHLAREVYDPGLSGLLQGLLADRRLRAELRRAPCSPPASGPRTGAHHAFLGGLLEHTVAVATMALELCAVHPRLDRDLLLCAALVHDMGKTREFTYGAEVGLTEEGRLLGHVELGLRLIAAYAPATLAVERRLALEHCVIAHHGAEGTRARFASTEALALYRINALDASVKGAFERGL
jgi:3'-5' exoribonuclease